MSDLSGSQRRRRADAERSIGAILDAAVDQLNRNPDASMAEIAAASGLTRQTVYAHFPSRETLLTAVVERATEQAMAGIDLTEPEGEPATEAMVRLLDASWRTIRDYPLLLHLPPAAGVSVRDRHEPVLGRLGALVGRGQASGEFDPGLPADWLVAGIIALGEAAGDEVSAGRLSNDEAEEVLRTSVLRLLGVTGQGRPGRAPGVEHGLAGC